MARRSRKVLVLLLPGVYQSPPGLIKTVKTNQFEEVHYELRQNLPMRCSSVFGWFRSRYRYLLDSEETDRETQRRTLVFFFKKTHLVTGYNSFNSNPNNMWVGVTSGLEEEDRGVKLKGKFPWGAEKKRYAVENTTSRVRVEHSIYNPNPLWTRSIEIRLVGIFFQRHRQKSQGLGKVFSKGSDKKSG